MLELLRCEVTDRKRRLFGVACCRRLWDCLVPHFRRAVDAEESSADSQLTEREGVDPDLQSFVQSGSVSIIGSFGLLRRRFRPGNPPTDDKECLPRCALIRDIFGNPFRPSSLDCVSLTRTVTMLAQAAYEERTLPAGTLDPDRLAILADALEDAGCTDADILSHLRGPGPHVRGCFAIDLILGKK